MAKKKTTEKKERRLVSARGRIFQGTVIKKFQKRIVIELIRTVYVKKYERYQKKKTKIHARIQEGQEVEVGDVVRVMECRPLSKLVHAVMVENVSKGDKK